MANNDKIQQIVSNIKLLNDLTNSMIDSEIYPVSFFSRAFDLMQKIQGDFHKLEAGQVELFASQMKKHQALILSVHKQMRNMDDSSDDHPAASTVDRPAASTADHHAASTADRPVASTADHHAASTVDHHVSSTADRPVSSTADRPATSTADHPATSTADHPTASTVPKAVQPSVTGPAPLKKEVIAGQQEDKQKKVSFLSRLGIGMEPVIHKAPVREPAASAKSATDPSTVAKTEGASDRTSSQTISETRSYVKKTDALPPQRPASKTIEAPIRVQITKPFAEKTLPEKEIPVEKTPEPAQITTPLRKESSGTIRPPEPSISETVKRTAKSTITLPESSADQRIRPLRPEGVHTPSGISKTQEHKVANISGRIPAEGSAPPSVNDAMEKRKLSDLRKAFSLNDRFLYRRELFGGNEEVMNRVITALNNKTSYKESILFLEEKLKWDFTNPTVKDFIKILEIRFL
jgi:hypothetical protein